MPSGLPLIIEKLDYEYSNYTIYPPRKEVFKAFELTAFDEVKVVILGQDPYYRPNQANGLAFSVNDDIAIPRSLKNIFKESNISAKNGDLTPWAKNGVFLLNTALTVRAGQPNSHRILWRDFTLEIIKRLNERKEGIIFMLWGNNAIDYKDDITNPQHIVLTASHPSPLSAKKVFFGCNHFKIAEEILGENIFKL
ncbi:MAG: uracil-DNA glycosylase [Oscillospiraceae bacterium]|nr:uracil-DNA glycosylase [Oscillospiraceae bacterium]